MAKIQHLRSETAGDVPASLLRGQVAINIPDALVYANDPGGNVSVISRACTSRTTSCPHASLVRV
jgi:hypothetical protein